MKGELATLFLVDYTRFFFINENSVSKLASQKFQALFEKSLM